MLKSIPIIATLTVGTIFGTYLHSRNRKEADHRMRKYANQWMNSVELVKTHILPLAGDVYITGSSVVKAISKDFTHPWIPKDLDVCVRYDGTREEIQKFCEKFRSNRLSLMTLEFPSNGNDRYSYSYSENFHPWIAGTATYFIRDIFPGENMINPIQLVLIKKNQNNKEMTLSEQVRSISDTGAIYDVSGQKFIVSDEQRANIENKVLKKFHPSRKDKYRERGFIVD